MHACVWALYLLFAIKIRLSIFIILFLWKIFNKLILFFFIWGWWHFEEWFSFLINDLSYIQVVISLIQRSYKLCILMGLFGKLIPWRIFLKSLKVFYLFLYMATWIFEFDAHANICKHKHHSGSQNRFITLCLWKRTIPFNASLFSKICIYSH